MDEYPKVVRIGQLMVTVTDAADEAKWLGAVPPAVTINNREPDPEPENRRKNDPETLSDEERAELARLEHLAGLEDRRGDHDKEPKA